MKKRILNIETGNNFKIKFDEEDDIKNDTENEIISNIKEFMEKELKFIDEDISYKWIEKDLNLKYLNKCIETDLMNIKSVINKRDLECELNLIKLITEDKKHKAKLIELPKEHKKMNRYPDILPYSYNTVYIEENDKKINLENENLISENNYKNYINGSYISGPKDEKLFIATQGPLTNTIESFWKLILNKNIKLIIMLSNLQEEGRKKCDLYWPNNKENPILLENIKIELESEIFILENAILQRNFKISENISSQIYVITQLQMICWPDHSIPEEEVGYKSIEMMISYVDDFRNLYQTSPIITHCR